jgi:hypothetical protein
MGHDVIISYATIDKPIADAVCAKLEERGIRCWIAPRDILPSEDYAASIISGIDNAKLMVLILSSHANASQHVMREAERAVHSAIPIIPFRIEDIQPNPSLQYYISGQHWLDALTPPLEEHILKLAETVSVLLNKSISPPTQSIQPKSAASLPPPVSKRVTLRRITNMKLYGLFAGYIIAGLWSLIWGWAVYTNLVEQYWYGSGLSWVVPYVVVIALCGLTAVNLLVRRTMNWKFSLTFWVAPAVAVILFASISPLFPSEVGGISVVGNAGAGFEIFLVIDAVPLLLLSLLSFMIVRGYGTELVAADR